MAKSSALSSLGRFFSGGAGAATLGGVSGFLRGGMGGAITGAAKGYLGSSLAGGAAQGLASGLGRFVKSPGTLGGLVPGGGSTYTRIIPGNPQAQPQQQLRGGVNRVQDLRPLQYLPDRPSSFGRSSGGSSGGGGGGLPVVSSGLDSRAIKETLATYFAKQKEANEANEARYQQLLGISGATTGQRAKDITSDFANQQSMAMQNLAGLGLANTSGASTIRGGFGRRKSEALDRLADTMQQTKLGIIERRTDAAPDLGSYTALAQLMGTAVGQERARTRMTPAASKQMRGYGL